MKENSWEFPEIVAASILVAVGSLGFGGLASGIVGIANNSSLAQVEGTAQILTQATAWAEFVAAFMVLMGLLVIWWHTETWSEVLEPAEDRAEGELEQGVVQAEAVRHMLRGSAMALWAGRLTGVIALGSIANFTASQFEFGPSGQDPFVWQLRIVMMGGLAATLVLSTAGILGTTWVRRLCSQYVRFQVRDEDEV
jgi:hypothetical protein